MTTKHTPSPVKGIADAIYTARKDRRVHPEGSFDKAKRWYPSNREDADGDGTCVRSPTRAYPFSYMLRCRTRAHCVVLAERLVAGLDVPPDVQRWNKTLPPPVVQEAYAAKYETPEETTP